MDQHFEFGILVLWMAGKMFLVCCSERYGTFTPSLPIHTTEVLKPMGFSAFFLSIEAQTL